MSDHMIDADVATNESAHAQEVVLDSFIARHRFFILVFATIVIAFILVVISLVMYNVTGAAQLDFSRPGLQSVRDQVERNDTIDGFSAIGTVDKDVIKSYLEQYDEQAAKTTAVDAFGGDPLNPELLEFSDGSGSK